MNAWLRAGSHVMSPTGPSISSAVCAIGSECSALEVAEDPEGLDQCLGHGRRTATGPWQRRRGRQGHAPFGSARVRARPRLAVVPVQREHAPVLRLVGSLDLEQVHPLAH